MHNKGSFPLEGAHLATPCIACHQKNEEWSFKDIGQQCVDCHKDVHEGFLNEKYYPKKSCNQCHVADAWDSVTFEHQATGFELQGKHNQTSCTKCHKPDTEQTDTKQVAFTGLKQDCISCHEDIHDRQFELEGVTDCRRCHKFEAWKPSDFDHNTARFVLDGAHKDVACVKCHTPELVDGTQRVKYRLEQFECATCHRD
jgi:nitrate/TMAO reductase-like tetraheme cytochrome c subunit